MNKRTKRLERGREAEFIFREWLNVSKLAYMAIDQSLATIPENLMGHIKRPDFLVGLPTMGTLAFEVKSKSIYSEHLVFEAEERRRLRNFQTFFNITVWFACFDPETPTTCRLFLNDYLFEAIRGERRLDRDCVHLPICDTFQVDIWTNTLFEGISGALELF